MADKNEMVDVNFNGAKVQASTEKAIRIKNSWFPKSMLSEEAQTLTKDDAVGLMTMRRWVAEDPEKGVKGDIITNSGNPDVTHNEMIQQTIKKIEGTQVPAEQDLKTLCPHCNEVFTLRFSFHSRA